MIAGKSILGLIPARGGSKGVPRKNIKNLAGKPLIAWTIEAARKSKILDRIIISSEDEEILQVAQKFGIEAPFVRPKELARDDTPGVDVVLHALENCPGFDIVVLLQPTSPLRTAEDIDHCISKMIAKKSFSCASVTIPDKSPYWMYNLDPDERLVPLFRDESSVSNRQELPETYVLNGALYVDYTDWLFKNKSLIGKGTLAYLMPRVRSIDIDDEIDFAIAQAILL